MDAGFLLCREPHGALRGSVLVEALFLFVGDEVYSLFSIPVSAGLLCWTALFYLCFFPARPSVSAVCPLLGWVVAL